MMLAAEAADSADMVVIDWFLDGRTGDQAKQIIRRILKEDWRANGRLRLFAVYTSASNLLSIEEDTLLYVNEDEDLKDYLSLDEREMELRGRSTLVIFLSKQGTVGALEADIVGESELPARLMDKFSKLTYGVLPNFAISAIAAIRQAANHVATIFATDLDGAYVAHRCSLPDPDDAQGYAVDLIASEFRNVISVNRIADDQLSADVLGKWVDALDERGHKFRNHEGAEAPTSLVKEFIQGGAAKVDGSRERQQLSTASTPSIKCESIGRIFYGDKEDAWGQCHTFARLSTLKREAKGRLRYPKEWRPFLTLGSILECTVDGGARFIVCVQPRCDSVRLKQPTAFPFLATSAGTKKFDLVVRDHQERNTELMVSSKLSDLIMLKFTPSAEEESVRATWKVESQSFEFQDVEGVRYHWLGDLKDFHAQRIANDLAVSAGSVGLDENEWLRRARKGDFKRP